MNSDLLTTFLAVADEGSMRRAASKLGISPGAVALRLRAAEAELGVELVVRAGRRVAVGPAGTGLIASARAVVRSLGDLRAAALLGASDGIAACGELRMGAIATAVTGLLPPLLAEFAARHPRLTFVIDPGASPDLYGRVNAGELDCAIIVQPPHPLRKSEAFSAWRTEPMGLAVPPHWAGRDAADLIASAPFIRYDRRSWGGRLVENYLAQNGFRPRDRCEIDALDGAFAMVAAGLGTAILPDWRSPYPQEAMVVIKALPGPPLSRVIGLYYRLGTARANLVRALDAISEAASPSASVAAVS